MKEIGEQFLKAYAWILFSNKPLIGAIFIGATFYQPNIGLSGLIAAMTAALTVRTLQFNYANSGVHIFNAALVGLSLGAFYQFSFSLFLILIFSAILTVVVTVMLLNILLRLGNLPVLTAPFVLVAITLAFATQAFGNLSVYTGNIDFSSSIFPVPMADFFTAIGSVFFLPHPVVGFILFACIVWQSRYMAFLCLTGFIIGFQFYDFLAGNQPHHLTIYNGFNFCLTAMAIGGIYTVPGIRSFAIACLATFITALITAASQSFMALHGLPVMALPFIITTLTFLSALNSRATLSTPWLTLDNPDLPEKNYERSRLAQARVGDFRSVSLLPPFFGEWTIYQGFNGEHTHQPPWQYALDFIVTENGQSYRDKGESLEDYFCYGLPVRSPVYGTVAHATDDLIDNPPGEVDIQNVWGNHIVIEINTGLYVLIAHLQHHSIKVKQGENISPGKIIANCGNTGRSPQPHIHLQIQVAPVPGSNTYPFHLSNIIIKGKAGNNEFKLASVPVQGQSIFAAEIDAALSKALHLPVGKILHYEVNTSSNELKQQRRLHVALSLFGEFILESDSGATVAFVENNGLIAFYNRQGPKDSFLDNWLLCLGLTPLVISIECWEDAPTAALLPLNKIQKLLYMLRYPLGTGLNSQYQRSYDETRQEWIQTASHTLKLSGQALVAESRAIISHRGCEQINLRFNNLVWRADLQSIESSEDVGIKPRVVQN